MVCSSQRITVVRKLEIITCTPIVTETAIMSAATATPVRLCERMTLRGARRPSKPNSLPRGSPKSRISDTVTHGVSAASPITTADVPLKLITRSRVGMVRTAAPMAAITIPNPATRLTIRCTLLSNPARESARRGGTEAASQAGGAAASTLARNPVSPPLSRLEAGIWMPRTLTTK